MRLLISNYYTNNTQEKQNAHVHYIYTLKRKLYLYNII